MAKPEFDPNQPFQAAPADPGAKPAFDPSQPFTAHDKEPSIDEPMPGEGFGSYLKRTYLPSLMQVPKAALGAATHVAENIPVLGPLATRAGESAVGYLAGDDAQQKVHAGNEAESNQFMQDHPGQAVAASLGGAAMLPMPFAGAKGALGVGGRIVGNAALAGADQAAQGKDPIKGAEIGGGMTAGAEALLGSAGAAAGRLSNIAEQRAVKAATGQNSRVIKDALASGKISLEDNGHLSSTMGRDLLTSDEAGPAVVGRLDKVEDIAPKAAAKAQFYGEKIGDVGKQIDAVVPKAVNGDAIADKIEAYAKQLPDAPSQSAVRNRLLDEANYYRSQGFMSFSDAQTHKGLYKFKPTDQTTQVLGQDATNFIKGAVSDEMDTTAADIAKSPSAQDNPAVGHLLDQYQYYKDKYGSFKTIADASQQRVGKNLANSFGSPTDKGVGMAALAGLTAHGTNPIVSVPTAIGAAAVSKFARERGSAFSANIANDLSKLLSENPSALGQYRQVLQDAANKGSANLGLTHFLLMKSDPQYQQLMQGVQP